MIRRTDGTSNNAVIGRGADTDGSIGLYMDDTQVQMTAFTTSGGVTAQVINVAVATPHSRWYLLMGAYKSGSYVKVGIDGVWLGTTNFVQTGLRTSATGLQIGQAMGVGGTNGTFDGDIAMVEIGSGIPTDNTLYALNSGIRSASQPPVDGGDPPPTDAGTGVHRMLLLGAG